MFYFPFIQKTVIARERCRKDSVERYSLCECYVLSDLISLDKLFEVVSSIVGTNYCMLKVHDSFSFGKDCFT